MEAKDVEAAIKASNRDKVVCIATTHTHCLVMPATLGLSFGLISLVKTEVIQVAIIPDVADTLAQTATQQSTNPQAAHVESFSFEPEADDNPESFFLMQDELQPEHYHPTPMKTVLSKPIKLQSAKAVTVETVKIEQEDEPHMVPTTLSVAKKVNEKEGRLFFKSLFNSGGTSVMINKRVIPTDCEIFDYASKAFATTQGTFTSPDFVYLTDLALPEITLTRRIKKIKAYLFDAPNICY